MAPRVVGPMDKFFAKKPAPAAVKGDGKSSVVQLHADATGTNTDTQPSSPAQQAALEAQPDKNNGQAPGQEGREVLSRAAVAQQTGKKRRAPSQASGASSDGGSEDGSSPAHKKPDRPAAASQEEQGAAVVQDSTGSIAADQAASPAAPAPAEALQAPLQQDTGEQAAPGSRSTAAQAAADQPASPASPAPSAAAAAAAGPSSAAKKPAVVSPFFSKKTYAHGSASAAGSHAPGTAAAAATGSNKEEEAPLDLHLVAEQHLQQARQVIAAAAAEGRQPGLRDLLLEPTWVEALREEMRKPYFASLQTFVHREWSGKVPIYPPKEVIFKAFHSCPLDKVRVVVLGQDPYHGPNQGMGLCFSVNRGVRMPPSLVNIYKELAADVGCTIPKHGDLTSWAHQGVLLLNTVLTVRAGEANSHKKQGWEQFTDAAIRTLSLQGQKGIVFLLWGKPAQEKAKLINVSRHHVLKAAHPSPLASASGNAFAGCKHFSTTNRLLQSHGHAPINWQIDP